MKPIERTGKLRAVIQRVSKASVTIDQEVYSAIEQGYMVLLGVEVGDVAEDAQYMIDKIANLRVFTDDNDKMNLSIKDVKGSVLLVSQFTLAGDVRKGRRPNFMGAERPEKAIPLYERVKEGLEEHGLTVETGEFGAMMNIELVNHGPVTILLDSHKVF